MNSVIDQPATETQEPPPAYVAPRPFLTIRQTMVLDFVRRHLEEHGYPPTLREIGKHMGIRSTNGVNDHLRALERKGYLRRADLLSRGIRIGEFAPPVLERQTIIEENTHLRRLLGRVLAEVQKLDVRSNAKLLPVIVDARGSLANKRLAP